MFWQCGVYNNIIFSTAALQVFLFYVTVILDGGYPNFLL